MPRKRRKREDEISKSSTDYFTGRQSKEIQEKKEVEAGTDVEKKNRREAKPEQQKTGG